MAIPNGGHTAFKIGPRLGRSGDVYDAHHPGLACRVALKLYRRGGSPSATAIEAFAREATRASGLRHPHIAQVNEVGALQDGTPFTAFEFLVGQTLEERMVGRGAFLATELLPLVRGTASALSAAHAAGVFHRELRPDNIFIVDLAGYAQGFVKLLDFGACHLTAAQIVAGHDPGARAARMFAPEQRSGQVTDGDARSDQFALAAIAYRMLNGIEPPLATRTGATGMQTDAGRAPVTNLARRAPAVDAVVSKALHRDPGERFESVALFLRAFEEALTGASLISTPAPHVPVAESANTAPSVRLVPGGASRGPASAGAAANNSAVDPSSLSQRFFDEGDLQEATRFKNLHPEQPPVPLEFDSFDRIPTRRKPLLIALLLMVACIGTAAWWAGVRIPEAWRQSSLWQRLPLTAPRPQAGALAPEPAPVPAAGGAQLPGVPPAAGEDPGLAAASQVPVELPTPAAPVAAPNAAPAAAAVPADPVPAVPDPADPVPAVPDPAEVPTAAAAPDVPAGPGPAGDSVNKPNAAAKSARPSPAPKSAARPRTGPLYLWSPEKQAMVPVLPGESSPQ